MLPTPCRIPPGTHFGVFVRALLIAAGILGYVSHAAALEVEELRRVSIASDGNEATERSGDPSISSNGRFVTFASGADNLVPGDTNSASDAFIHDLRTDETRRVSVSSGGLEANGNSGSGTVSDFGDVAFESVAENLVAVDTNAANDIFVHDLGTGITTRVNVLSNGDESIPENDGEQGGTHTYDITPDGRYVLFRSRRKDLVPQGIDANSVYVHDRVTGETTRISEDETGFAQEACCGAEITPDGRYVAFSGAGPAMWINDNYVKDRLTGELWLTSLNSEGEFLNTPEFGLSPPSISDDGRYVVFATDATNGIPNDTNGKPDIFLRDRQLGVLTRIIEDAHSAKISGDGRFVVAQVASCTPEKVIVHDRVTNKTIRVSVDKDGRIGNGQSSNPSISADGRLIAFHSSATNLIDDDTNGVQDIFVASIGDGDGPRGNFVDLTDTDGDGTEDECDGDDDNDEMDDRWELAYGFDPLDAADADLDADGDGLTNVEEYRVGMNPSTNDTDGDTVLDAVDNCPLDSNADQADNDGDGHLWIQVQPSSDAGGDICDIDDDNDNVMDFNDSAPFDCSIPEPSGSGYRGCPEEPSDSEPPSGSDSEPPSGNEGSGGGGSISPGLSFLLGLIGCARRGRSRLPVRSSQGNLSRTSSLGGIGIRIFALTFGSVTPVDVTHAQVQGNSPDAIETIEVVGSHIRGIDPERLLPVLVLSRPEIERTGAISVAEVLQQLPMNNAGAFNDRDALSSALGGTSISFRGLGANSVLILINGRRATNYGFSHATESGGLVSFVDLNNIPIAAVERIEILKDGASALYGSGAMAGVVNIVLRRGFTGTEIEARLGATTGGGAEEQAFSALFGWASPRTSVEFIATYTNREQLSWSDRAISDSANHEDQGGLDQRSYIAGSLGGECEERNTTDGTSGFVSLPTTGICLYDPNAETVVPSAERLGLMALLSHELTPDLTLLIEAGYLSSQAEGRRESVPWTGGVFPTSNPWNPFGQDVLADYRFSETGSRVDTIETDNTRVVVALEGEFGEWNWDFAALHHNAATEAHGEGYLSADRIEQALTGIDINGDGTLQQDEYWNLYSPASNPNSLALTDSLTVPTFRKSVTELTSYIYRMARDLFQLPAGNVTVAFGLEHRTESLDDHSDTRSIRSLLAATTISRDLLGFGVGIPRDQIDPYAHVDPVDFPVGPLESTGSPTTHGTISQGAVFGEIKIPLHERLDLQAALRYDDIKDFGEDFSPKLAVRFKVSDRLRTRASWGRSFRAPSPGEMHLGPSAKLQASWDPKRCPAFPGWVIPEIAGGCVVSQFVTTTWGNPDLDSEEAETTSVGIEAEVSEGHEVSLDCWKTEVRNKILIAQTAWIIRHEDDLPSGTIIRDPLQDWDITDPDMTNTHGTIAQVNVLPLNFGKQEVKGCDVEFDSDWEIPDGSSLQAQLIGTHLASNKLAFGTDDPFEELAGTYGHPKNRANLNVSWYKNNWQVGVYGRWTDEFDDTVSGKTVTSHTEWDAQISYSGLRTTKLTLGIENLFDEAPPFSVGNLHPQGFPVQFYDMRGRFIYAQATISLGRDRLAAEQ